MAILLTEPHDSKDQNALVTKYAVCTMPMKKSQLENHKKSMFLETACVTHQCIQYYNMVFLYHREMRPNISH